MNYEKLTVDRFLTKLKDGQYAGLTGARRAIGKTDWSEKERAQAHAAAAEYFDGKPQPKKQTSKKAAKQAKRGPGRPPKVHAQGSAKDVRDPADVRAPATASRRREPATSIGTGAVTSGIPPFLVRDDPAAVQASAASGVITALSGRTLTKTEQETYELAHEAYRASALHAAQRKEGAVKTVRQAAATEVTMAAGTAPRIQVPATVHRNGLSAEDQDAALRVAQTVTGGTPPVTDPTS